MEASAKTGLNAQNIFLKAAEILFDDYNKYQGKLKDENDEEGNDENNKEENKKLDKNINDKKKKGCC